MFENYSANEGDLKAIEDGIRACWENRLKNIFEQRKFLARVLIVSYDAHSLYLYSVEKLHLTSIPNQLPMYKLYELPHGMKGISANDQFYWRAGLSSKYLTPTLKQASGEKSEYSIVSGGLLTPFVALQKRKRRPLNPYTTAASYKATIVHEIAHAYFNQHRQWWFSNKIQNLRYLRFAKALYKGNQPINLSQLLIQIPNYGLRQTFLSEAFAFCAESTAARIFWRSHWVALQQNNALWLDALADQERRKNLNRENSVLEHSPGHAFAASIGRILLEQSPRSWPKRLLKSATLC